MHVVFNFLMSIIIIILLRKSKWASVKIYHLVKNKNFYNQYFIIMFKVTSEKGNNRN